MADGNVQLQPSGQHLSIESSQPSSFHLSAMRLLHATHSWSHSFLCLLTLSPVGNALFAGVFLHLHVMIFTSHAVLFGSVVALAVVEPALVDFVPFDSSWLLLAPSRPT